MNQNAYQPPTPEPEFEPKSSSAIPKVVGIISFVFAGLNLIGAIWTALTPVFQDFINSLQPTEGPQAEMQMELQRASQFPLWMIAILTLLVLGKAICALMAGLKLTQYRREGITWFGAYSMSVLLSTLIGVGWQLYAMPKAFRIISEQLESQSDAAAEAVMATMKIGMVIGAVFGLLFALLWPVIGLILLTRAKARQSLS